jgi:hypothetical protein
MSGLSLKERLDCGGNLSVHETQTLKGVKNTKFYDDVKHGRVIVEKCGGKRIVRAEIAKLYIAGKPMPQATEAV